MLSAHASSIDDPLLGVPLHCAAGLYAEAVMLLQVCRGGVAGAENCEMVKNRRVGGGPETTLRNRPKTVHEKRSWHSRVKGD